MWLKFYALQIGLPLEYARWMPLGELLDLINCWKISKGMAKEKVVLSEDDDFDLFPDLI